MLSITPAGGSTSTYTTLSASTSFAVAATARIYLDGVGASGNTYILESSADVMDFYVGGANTLKLSTTRATVLALTATNDATAARFIPTATTVPANGMYLPAANTLGFAAGSTLNFKVSATAISTPTSLYVGMNESTVWDPSGIFPATHYTGNGVAGSQGVYTNGVMLGVNLYHSGTGVFKYKTTNSAAFMKLEGSAIYWYTAPSGTQDTNITFTEGMALDSSGNLTLRGGHLVKGSFVEIGSGRSSNGAAHVDLIGDTTYTDYGFRIIRNDDGGGANGRTMFLHNGTGPVKFSMLTSGAQGLTYDKDRYQSTYYGIYAGHTSGVAGTRENEVAVGYEALYSNNSGSSGTAVGSRALYSATGGTNTAVGRIAGSTLTTGANCSFLGYNSQPSAVGVNNEITLGDSSIATLRCQVTSITALSDRRDKRDISDIPVELALGLIDSLNPVHFVWDARDGGKVGIKDSGFIAQDLLGAEIGLGLDEYSKLVYTSNPDKLEASASRLLPYLAVVTKNLNARVKSLESQLK